MPKQPLDWDARVVRRDLFRIDNVSLYICDHHPSLQYAVHSIRAPGWKFKNDTKSFEGNGELYFTRLYVYSAIA